MSTSAISSQVPATPLPQQQPVQNTQKHAQQAAVQQPAATDGDGDNDGSGGANITPPVNIKA